VVENASLLNIDPGLVAVGGDSSGGNLAAAVCLLTRDRGGPDLRFQLLVYPCTNCLYDSSSCREFRDGYFLTLDSMEWFRGHYLRDERDRLDPYASPLLAPDLGGLPPALVITAEYDPLRDEGEAYAARLQEAGNSVISVRYLGQLHGFSVPAFTAGRQALALQGVAVRMALG
jgi:acetyl esterase